MLAREQKELLAGLDNFRQANQQAREVSPRISARKLLEVEADKGSVRMLIVRHPFSR